MSDVHAFNSASLQSIKRLYQPGEPIIQMLDHTQVDLERAAVLLPLTLLLLLNEKSARPESRSMVYHGHEAISNRPSPHLRGLFHWEDSVTVSW